jgi:peptidoglycan/LPS O-acetylase OafA/YrhL
MEGRRALLPLTSLRFVAAAMIVVHHGLPVARLPNVPVALGQGVSFFFVLSGFVLAYSYPRLANWGEVRRFLIFRIARVWPAHAVTAIAAVVIFSAPVDAKLIANLTMTHAWIPSWPWFFSYNSVSWSISTEFFFYLLFPILIIAWSRTFWWKLALCALLLWVMMVVGRDLHLPDMTTADTPSLQGLLYTSPLARLLEFAAGMTMCLAFRWADPKAAALPGWVFTVAEVATLGFAAWLLLDHAFWGPALRLLPSTAGQYLANTGAWPSACLIVFIFAFQRGALSHTLSIRLALVLGEISYSLYLVHTMVFLAVAGFLGLTGIAAFTLGCAVSLALALTLWHTVERPARTAVRRLVGARSELRPALA